MPDDKRPGRVESARGRVAREADRAKRRFGQARTRVPFVDLLVGIAERFVGERGSILAGYLAYRLFLLLLPLVVVIVALAGFSGTAATDTSNQFKLGRTLANTIATAGAEAHTGRFVLLATGLFALVISAWGMLSALQFVSAQAWRIPTRRFPGKAKSFFGLSGSLVFLGAILYIASVVRNAGVVAGAAGSLATFASTAIAYFGLGWILPRRSKEWFWLLPGMAVGAVGHVPLPARPLHRRGSCRQRGGVGTTPGRSSGDPAADRRSRSLGHDTVRFGVRPRGRFGRDDRAVGFVRSQRLTSRRPIDRPI